MQATHVIIRLPFRSFSEVKNSTNTGPGTEARAATPQVDSNRCLSHCWLDDAQREQGERCLVACWQNAHCAIALRHHRDAGTCLLAAPVHPCHGC
jgi:hypothetical protein